MGKKLSFAPEQTPLFSQHTRLLQLCACEWESIIVVSIWINRISTHSRKYTHTHRQLHLKKRDDDDNDACKHTAFPAFSWEEEALFFFEHLKQWQPEIGCGGWEGFGGCSTFPAKSMEIEADWMIVHVPRLTRNDTVGLGEGEGRLWQVTHVTDVCQGWSFIFLHFWHY